MTMRLDIMTNDAGENVRRERARELGADVLVELYKLLKLAAVHDLQNQAFLQQLERAHQKISEYTLKSGLDISILFAHKAVFVAGQLLRGSRSVYEAAVELGDMMNKIGGSDVFIDKDISPKELYQITEAVGNALRNASVDFRSPTPRFRLRAVKDAARLRGLELEQLAPEERIVRGYASAVVVMRRFFEDLSESHYTLPRRLKRVAQTLVDLSEGNVPLFLGVTEARNANFDDAGRAVNSAILAVAMARKLTSDAVVLSKVAIAALVHDVARPRAMAIAAQGEFGGGSGLSEDQEDELPRGTAAVLSALGRLNEASIHRTVIAFEAQWLRRKLYLGQPYGGARDPLLHARIVTMARRFNDAATPEPGLMPKAPDYAIAILDREFPDPIDKTLLRVLAETIRVVPMGSVVELSTGEVAEVERPTALGERPVVKIVIDARGARPRSPQEIDLSTDQSRSIKRVVETSGWQKGLSLGDTFDTDDSPHGPDSDQPVSDAPAAPPAPPPGFALPGPGQPPAIIHLAQVAPGGESPTVSPPKSTAEPIAFEGIPSAPRMPTATDDLVLEDDPLVSDDPLISDDPLVSDDPLISDDPLVADDAFDAAFDLPPPSPARPPVDDVRSVLGGTMVGGAAAPVAPMPLARPPLHFDPDPEPNIPAQQEEHTLYQASSFYDDPKAAAANDAPPAAKIARPTTATADGDLAGTPLPHVLIYMLEHQLDGTLLLADATGGETFVVFASGTPIKSNTNTGTALLGAVLTRMGIVQEAALATAIAAAKPLGVLLGEFLVSEGQITRGQLDTALRVQLIERLAALGGLGAESRYAFFQGVDLLEAVTGDAVRTSPLNAILAVVRAWNDDDKVQKTLDRIARAPLRLHPEAELSAFSFAPEETPLLAALRTGTTTVVEWSYRQGVDVRAMARVLYTLAVTRQFQLSGQTKAPLRGSVPGEFHPPLVISGRWQAPPSSRASMPPAAPSASAIRHDDPAASRRPQIRPIGATPRPATAYPSPFDDTPGSGRSSAANPAAPIASTRPPTPEPPVVVEEPDTSDPFEDDDPDGRTLFYTPAAREELVPASARNAPEPSAPVLPAPSAPALRPAAGAPMIRPAAGAPMIRPAAGAPMIRPAAGAPMIRPAAGSPNPPAVAPSSPSLAPNSPRSVPPAPLSRPAIRPAVAPAAPGSAPVSPAVASAPVASAPVASATRPVAPAPVAPRPPVPAAPVASPAVRPAVPGAPPAIRPAAPRPPIPAAPAIARPPIPGVPAVARPAIPIAPAVARAPIPMAPAAKPLAGARPLAPLPGLKPLAATPSIATGDDALAAAQEARNADAALQKGDLDGAEDSARAAMEKDPNQPEYQALLAWVHSRQDPARSAQALAVFDRILTVAPELERVILYRARLRRELGQGAGAIDDYELLLDLNPLHVEATREILESKRNPGRP